MSEESPVTYDPTSPAVETPTEEIDDVEEHEVFNVGIIVIFGLLIIFMLFEAFKHKHHLKFGHEASLVCVIGVIISAIYAAKGQQEFNDFMAFNDDLFFYFVLPPIIFASGFNMYRKKFFANIGNISLLGVLGTFVTFGAFTGLALLGIKNISFSQSEWDHINDQW